MDYNGVDMDKIGIMIKRIIHAIHSLKRLPITYMEMDTGADIKTIPQSLLEIYTIWQGELRFSTAGKEVMLRKGEVLITTADKGNEGAAGADSTRQSCVSLDYSNIPGLSLPAGLILTITGLPLAVLRPMLREMYFAFHAEAYPLQDVIVKRHYMDLLIALAGHSAPGLVSPAEGDPRVRQAVRFLQENHAEADIALADIAATVHLSVDHLLRIFRQEKGISPMQYLQRFRMEKANRLLRQSSLSVKQVARAVGFGDALYFSRAFRKHYHESPSACRKSANSRGI